MKIAMVVNSDFATWHFRRGLIKALVAAGHDVLLLTPEGTMEGKSCVEKLESLGARHIVLPLTRFPSLIRDAKSLIRLVRILRKERPDIVHNMAAKANVFGAIAGRLARVDKVVSLVCGVGYGFGKATGLRQRIIGLVVNVLYRVAGRLTDKMWFLNEDDRDLFVRKRVVRQEHAIVIRGEGIDLEEFNADLVEQERVSAVRREIGAAPSDVVVGMMLARVTWSKGVREFIEASELASSWGCSARFVLAGPLDPGSPDAVPRDYLTGRPRFVWLGFRNDIRDLLAAIDVVTLPSYYPEGLPRALLEGMAMRKPIVTTDNVGCREAVDDGKSGFLVPVKDSKALAAALRRLAESPELRTKFGRMALAKARDEFAEDVVNGRVFRELYDLNPDLDFRA